MRTWSCHVPILQMSKQREEEVKCCSHLLMKGLIDLKKKKSSLVIMLALTFSQYWRFLHCVKQEAIGLYAGYKFQL